MFEFRCKFKYIIQLCAIITLLIIIFVIIECLRVYIILTLYNKNTFYKLLRINIIVQKLKITIRF